MKNENPAQVIEGSLKQIALGLLLLTISYGLSLIMYVSSETVIPYMEIAQKAVGILVIIVVLPAFYKLMKLRFSNAAQCHDHDNYMAATFRHASAFAFSITFVSLVAVELVGTEIEGRLPISILINGIEFIALGAFTASFFLKLSRDKIDDADDEFDGEAHS